MQVKALSLTQPWANLIRDRHKTVETRTWSTNYRGPLLICATRQRVAGCPGPYGQAVAVAWLAGCRPMRIADERLAHCCFYPGALAWDLVSVVPVGPFTVRGALNLFTAEIGDEYKAVVDSLSAACQELIVRISPDGSQGKEGCHDCGRT